MSREISGIHHITAIAGDPQANIDFYVGLLGLRMIKLTVNYDDPGTYHIYYGDRQGHPGTILTFFPWPDAPRGRHGTGQVTATAFAIPQRAIGYWVDRLKSRGADFEGPHIRFEEEVISLRDGDGLELELVAHASAEGVEPWREGPVPEEYAIRGFYGVTITLEGYERSAGLLTATMGFRAVGEKGNRFRYECGSGGPGRQVDLVCVPAGRRGVVAVGAVHHIAWRTPNDEQQKAWREEIANRGLNVTPIIDRTYFHSIYFREPGGVLFEIATDPPGFTVDEPLEKLGLRLVLPAWLESSRAELRRALPEVHLPAVAKTAAKKEG